jgi:hypothetical protein
MLEKKTFHLFENIFKYNYSLIKFETNSSYFSIENLLLRNSRIPHFTFYNFISNIDINLIYSRNSDEFIKFYS